jgi:hypothetical protein
LLNGLKPASQGVAPGFQPALTPPVLGKNAKGQAGKRRPEARLMALHEYGKPVCSQLKATPGRCDAPGGSWVKRPGATPGPKPCASACGAWSKNTFSHVVAQPPAGVTITLPPGAVRAFA